MKRVIMFGGRDHRPARDLNVWLAAHPSFELLDVSAVGDDIRNILLYCTVEVPADASGLEARYSEYFGLQEETE
ncbi:MAG: hypothetical protein LUH14_06080 [Clostridiaceae bacterium]|nr:hypothetical protein [Clostridiaceae bacterium]